MSNLLENGIYDAVFNGNASVYDSKAGNLTVCFEVMIGDVVRKAYCALFQKNGTEINERQIKRLKYIFGKWDGDNPEWFLDADNIRDVPCEVRVENEGPDSNGNTWSNVKEIFAPGANQEGGGGSDMPASMDKKELQAKYGAKFRAIAGKTGKPVGPAVPKVAAPMKQNADTQLPS